MRSSSSERYDDTESREITELVRPAAEQEGFPLFDLELTEDSTFTPAVYISFRVHSADQPTKGDLEAAQRLRKKVEAALFEHGVTRIPYIRFREALKSAS